MAQAPALGCARHRDVVVAVLQGLAAVHERVLAVLRGQGHLLHALGDGIQREVGQPLVGAPHGPHCHLRSQMTCMGM